MKRRILFIAFAFTLILSLSLFAGCGEITEGPNGNSTPSASSSSSSSSSSSYEDNSSSSSSSSSTGSSSDSSSGQETCDHVFGDYEIITPATCIAEGEKKRTCSKCGEVQTEKIQNSEHSYGEWVIDANATCETAGSKHRICTTPNCGEQETSSIDALGHDGNPCSRCQLKFSEGLEFALSDDGESYGVSRIGTCTDQHVVIPSTYDSKPVTSIGEGAFSNCSFTNVTIPNSVTYIGSSAFAYCSSLTEITIPDSVTSIGDKDVFLQCENVKSVTIGNGLKEIPPHAFSYCYFLETLSIGSNVETIATGAFQDCSYLKTITIPDSVKRIESNAFPMGGDLESVYLGSGVTYLDQNFSQLTIPNLYIKDLAAFCQIEHIDTNTTELSITSRFENLYLNNELVTDLVIPEGVTSISAHAFLCYQQLKSVTIPDSVKSIGSRAFYGTSISRLEIGKNVETIGDYAFSECRSLKTVVISDNVTTIGNYAFANCYGITSLTIGKGVKTIGENSFDCAFNYQSQPDEIKFTGTKEEWWQMSMQQDYKVWTFNGNETYKITCNDGETDLIPTVY